MRKALSLFTAAAISLSLCTAGAWAADYADVASDAPYAQAVESLTEKGIMKGVGNGSFAPEATLTRAELAVVLGRVLNTGEVDNEKDSAVFSDVKGDGWSAGYIDWAAEQGLLAGYEGRFSPMEPVTQEQVDLILERVGGMTGVTVKGYAAAQGNATRGEIAVIVDALVDELESGAVERGTAYGSVRGYWDVEKDAYVWKGVPYAQAERWGAPEAPDAWTETLDCTQPGAIGIQYSSGEIIGEEDCLNLDIYAPADAENLPVLVYIHGGNNQTGNSAEMAGEALANKANCIYVSINYRLGALGFNCLPALKTGDQLLDSGNYTLLDFAAALDWVKENIGAFGGDGSNITISGFSAGGRDVVAMLTSPIFEGKFQQAIAFSGSMTIADEADSVKVYAEAFAPLAVEDGMKATAEEAYQWLLTDGDDVEQWLRGLSAERVAALMPNADIRMSAFPHLFGDGYVLPEEGFDTRDFNDVPVMLVSGSTEFSFPAMGGTYAGERNSEEWNQEFQFAIQYGSPLYEYANTEEVAAKLTQQGYDSDIYTLAIDFGNGSINNLGAFHGVFLRLLDTFSTSYGPLVGDVYYTDGALGLSDAFCAYIGSFMRGGDPNTDGQTEWTPWAAEGVNSMVFGTSTEQAEYGMADRHIVYDDVLAQLDADTTLSAERKAYIIANVLNGRWFSAKLDSYYGNLDLWAVEYEHR